MITILQYNRQLKVGLNELNVLKLATEYHQPFKIVMSQDIIAMFLMYVAMQDRYTFINISYVTFRVTLLASLAKRK